MRTPQTVFTQIAKIAARACAFAFGLSFGAMACAESVTLAFQPPEITSEPICVPKPADELIEANWKAWKGDVLPDQTPEQIRGDMGRLMQLDAVKWFATIEKVYALMPSVDSKFGPDKAKLERVALLIAAGKIKELTNQRLIEELMASKQGTSPKMLNTLSDYLMTGVGVKQDKEKALSMLVASGYGGNADALLKIVTLQQAGTEVPGWVVPQDISVTMAFGALVGKLDPMICDRVSRIAREYMNGTIVTKDVKLAEAWFKFAADLGDTASAWKIAEIHLRGEDLQKSNNVLIKYLTMAADGGLPFAQVTLGRTYELGALVPKDIEHARALYAAAAQFGDRAGVVRNVLFLQSEAKADKSKELQYRTALTELAKRSDAPSWTYVSLAEFVLQDKGRWAGEKEAVALLQKAFELGDPGAAKILTPILFRQANSPEEFYTIVDEVMQSVHLNGEIDPMNGLKSAFTCRSPNAPQREEANYWRDISAATGTKTVEFSPQELLALIKNPDVQEIARLQSQALYGRPAAIAQYMAVMERSGASLSQLAFWQKYALRFEKVAVSRGRLERKFSEFGKNIGDPATYFRIALADGDLSAGVDLAEYLMDTNPQVFANESTAALLPLAATGNGVAMTLLQQTDPKMFPDAQTVYNKYAKVIEANGDFDALLLAIPFLPNDEKIADYEDRARTITDCSFDQVMQLAHALGDHGDVKGFDHWLNIAEFLSEEDAWRMVKMGDAIRQYGDASTVKDQIKFYEAAYKADSLLAIQRLLEVYSKTDLPTYNPSRAADLYVDLLGKIEPAEISNVLHRIAKAAPAISSNVFGRVDKETLYLASAEAGSPEAMLELGKLIRLRSISADDLAKATDWIGKSADLGDADAMVVYADALAFGIGVEASREKALVWLTKAAKAGNEEAVAKVRGLSLEAKVSQ